MSPKQTSADKNRVLVSNRRSLAAEVCFGDILISYSAANVDGKPLIVSCSMIRRRKPVNSFVHVPWLRDLHRFVFYRAISHYDRLPYRSMDKESY